jgi:hypothetical protein
VAGTYLLARWSAAKRRRMEMRLAARPTLPFKPGVQTEAGPAVQPEKKPEVQPAPKKLRAEKALKPKKGRRESGG